jgi:hypothetical protein
LTGIERVLRIWMANLVAEKINLLRSPLPRTVLFSFLYNHPRSFILLHYPYPMEHKKALFYPSLPEQSRPPIFKPQAPF